MDPIKLQSIGQEAVLHALVSLLIKEKVLDRDEFARSLLNAIHDIIEHSPTESSEINAMEVQDYLLDWLGIHGLPSQ